MSSLQNPPDMGVREILREGFRLSPAFTQGIWLTLILAMMAAVGRLVVPMTVQQVTDATVNVTGSINTSKILGIAAGAVLLLITASICGSWANIRLFRATETGLAQLRVTTFRHIHELSVLTQSTERKGSLVSRVTSDVDTISHFVQWGGMMLFLSSLQLFGATIAMAVYSWKLTIVVWVTYIPIFFIAPRIQRYLNKAYALVRERMGAFLGEVSETVGGVSTVHAYGIGPRVAESLNQSIIRLRKTAIRAQALSASAFATGVGLSGVALAAVVVVGAYLGIDADISVGGLLAFVFLVQIFTTPVNNATEVLNELQNALAGWRRIITVLRTPVDVADPQSPKQVPNADSPLIEIQDVSFEYPGGKLALRDISCRIEPRTTVAIVGETGSGKTTIARLITRFVDPTSGSVRFNGVDLRELSRKHVTEIVTLVPQEVFLFSETVSSNIAYGPVERTEQEIAAAVQDLGLQSWVDSLPRGLETQVGENGSELSAGERQLIALVRAYLSPAPIVILDEATSAVDPALESQITRAFSALTSARTTIAIAHRLSTAEAADTVLVVSDGEIVERGPHSELVTKGGYYSKLYESWHVATSTQG